MDDLLAVAPLLLVVVGAAGVLWWVWQRRRALGEGLLQLAERDGLTITAMPCDLSADALADRFGATPRGGRRYGVEHGVSGPARAELAGDAVDLELGAFRWWYEEWVQDENASGYERRTRTVAVARLPVHVPGWVRVRPEGVLGRLGLRRAGAQLASDPFNRRFRVEGSDPTLTLQLLDARVQDHLLTAGAGRTLDITGDLVVLGGSPGHRDGTLPGVIGELPVVRQDLATLLRVCPAPFWRAAQRPGPDPGPDPGPGDGPDLGAAHPGGPQGTEPLSGHDGGGGHR